MFTKFQYQAAPSKIAHSLLYTGSIQESKPEHSVHGGNTLGSLL